MSDEEQAGRAAAAARWYAELQAPDAGAETWDAFRAWECDPLNAAAFREIEVALSALGRTSLAAPVAAQSKPGRLSGAWLGGLAAAVLVTALVGLAFLHGNKAQSPESGVVIYATAVGEQRTVELADGSSAQLNTASRIEVAFTDTERLVRLVDGQAVFEVEPGRVPFVVEAAESRTRALGTAFEVYVTRGGAEITLLEGSVHVAATGAAEGEGVVLAPGERVTMSGGEVGEVVNVDLAAVMAWRTGVLQFTDVRLADAAEELNRYSTTKIVVDPRLAEARLSGSFRAGDQDMFVSALSLFLPVETVRSGDMVRIVPARE